MRCHLKYPDRYSGNPRQRDFFAVDIDKAKEHADDICKKMRVPYCLITGDGQVWNRDYCSSSGRHHGWHHSETLSDDEPLGLAL